jgi:hypothetical protein
VSVQWATVDRARDPLGFMIVRWILLAGAITVIGVVIVVLAWPA